MCSTVDRRPNVLLIICDDLAWGDLARHGNPWRAPGYLDRLHDQSVRLTQYRSGPMCAPARASLLTGRDYYRTGIVDTSAGRAMMHPDEVTVAEVAREAGYRTGLFGKWHLGDAYPLRPIDQGFDESITFNAGYIGQMPFPAQTGYTDPVLDHNGTWRRFRGYCTDIFTDEAIRFIEADPSRPFFVQVAYNCPHTPLEIDEGWVRPYLEKGLPEVFARVYGMVDTIDAGVGRLLAALERLGLADDTIVIFTSDHGPCPSARADGQDRFNAGLRGRKGTMYDGGLRVPFFLRWTRGLPAGREVSVPASPIDVLPTLVAACAWRLPAGVKIDGIDLLPYLRASSSRAASPQASSPTSSQTSPQTSPQAPFLEAPIPGGATGPGVPERNLYFQQDRMRDRPRLYQNYAVIRGRYKLCRPQVDAPDELYDLIADPREEVDLAARHPELVAALRSQYEAWFAEVAAERDFLPPRIVLGGPVNPVVLTRQDWRGPDRVHMTDDEVGYWEVEMARAGRYRVTVHLPAGGAEAAVAHLALGEERRRAGVGPGQGRCVFEALPAARGPARLEAWLEGGDGKRRGALYVEVESTEANTVVRQ